MKKPEPTPKKDENYMELILHVLNNIEIIKNLPSIEKDYPYWEKVKYKAIALNHNPISVWHFIKLQRTSRAKILNFNSISPDFNFQFNSTDTHAKLLHTFDLNLGGNFLSEGIIPNDDKQRYLISSIMEEAIASSQLEGAATTREEAKEMLYSRRKPLNESEKMILNNYITINRILELKNKPITEELLLEIHALITKGTLENELNEGKYRTNDDVNVVDNITGELFYIPPSATKLKEMMALFIRFANDEYPHDFIHPIVKGIILHFLIGYIHPFVDGNGRTARAIFYWYVISKGYWLFEYISISRILLESPSQYAKAYLYAEYDENDLTYFIDYNLKVIESGMESLKKYISKKIEEKKSIYEIVKNIDLNSRQAAIIKEIITDKQKSLTIKEVENKFAVVYQTARTDLMDLEKKGYLNSKLVGKTFIYFPSTDFDHLVKKVL